MKTLLLIGLLVSGMLAMAQTKIEKRISVQTNQKLVMNFDYPEIIKIHTWDKKEVLIQGEVSINRGENDSAFELQVATVNNAITVTSVLKDKENIPHRIVIKKGDEEFYFKAKDYNDPEVQKFINENGHEYQYMSNGIRIEVTLEVFVPRGMESKIEAKYGMVEVKDFDASLTVDAPYGGIDATIKEPVIGELTAKTRHGEILTNLNVKFKSHGINDNNDHWTEIFAKPGNGPTYALESKYGKVYLRKPN